MAHRVRGVLDPGVRNPAVAIFVDGLLTHASRVKLPRAWAKLERGARLALVARECALHVHAHNPHPLTQITYEFPQVYSGRKSKGDPNDLLLLAAVGAGFVGAFPDVTDVTAYLPYEWIGGLPKAETGDAWDSPRGARIRSRLSAEEIAAIVVSHDALDAVGLGLHAEGRFAPRRVYPGATE